MKGMLQYSARRGAGVTTQRARRFFCMTTNLTRGGPSAHQTGVLWRLVRASMTIVGLIPPLVEDGELLARPPPAPSLFASGRTVRPRLLGNAR